MNGLAVRLLKAAAGFVVLALLWQAAVLLVHVREEYFPPPWPVLALIFQLVASGSFLGAVAATIVEVVLGILLAFVLGVPVGLLLGRSRHFEAASRVVVELLRPLPAVALAPLAILVLGLGLRSIVALVAWTSFWPIIINAIYGAQGVDPLAIETARSLRLGRFAILRRVILPSAAPLIVTGVRIASAIGLAVAIAAEMVAGGGEGLGSWIVKEGSAGSLVPFYSATVVAGILGFLVNAALAASEHRLFRWHASDRLEPAT